MWNLLRTLSATHQIDVLSFAEPSLSDEQIAIATEKLRSHCRSVRVVVRRPVDLRPSLLDRSIHIEMFDCDEMRDELLEMVGRGGYDIVQFDKTELAQYALPGPAPVQLLVEHVVFYHAYRRQFLQHRQPSPARILEYLKLRRYELGACCRFDGVITMSKVDARLLRSRLPRHPCITDVPNGADTDYYRFSPRLAEGNDLLFVGNFDHSPNVDGVRFFLREVFPLVKASVPEARLFIVGPGPYHSLEEVASNPSVIPTGFVEDTRAYMERCTVFVAPILAGGGTRVKILEAMSAGIPVVSTTLGAEGLDVTPGTHLLIGDTARAFAEAVIRLLHNPDMRQRLRSNARSLVETHYSWTVIGERLEMVYRELLAKRGSAGIS